MGEVLTTSNFGDFSVSAVIKDVPGNSHLKFDCLLSVATIQEMMGDRALPRSGILTLSAIFC